MGVRGAATATIISQAVSAIWVLLFLTGKHTKLKIQKNKMRLNAQILIPVLALGLSPFIMQATESLLNVCFNNSLQRFGGDIAVGTMTILSSISQLLILPLQGITQGAQPIISFNYGAGMFMLGAQLACQQSFVALGQAKTSLLLACLRKLILLIPLIFILPIFMSNQVLAIFLAEPIADITAAIITVLTFKFATKKLLK